MGMQKSSIRQGWQLLESKLYLQRQNAGIILKKGSIGLKGLLEFWECLKPHADGRGLPSLPLLFSWVVPFFCNYSGCRYSIHPTTSGKQIMVNGNSNAASRTVNGIGSFFDPWLQILFQTFLLRSPKSEFCLICTHRDSNPDYWLRRPAFYPLNYGCTISEKVYSNDLFAPEPCMASSE